MVFSSLEFLFRFLPAVLLLYFIAPRKLKNLLLLLASLFFYAWGEPIYVFLMVFSCIINYALAFPIDKYRGTAKSKVALISSIVISLALLGFFKYADFLVVNVNNIFGTDISPLYLPLPIGISFYTFQILSYTIDVYRKNTPVQKNLIALSTYITLFPQLIAGPIVRYNTIAQELTGRKHSLELFAEGVHRFVIGLGKKVFIANNVALIWELSKTTADPSILLSWLGIIGFSFQIYFDFSGYSDMAIGLGRMLGFHYQENFNYPYISKNITEFWRRWHMSLSQWFRDYLYIPLGGNRVSVPRWILNILVVWSLTGFWHGASWNFMFWGFYFGVLLLAERLFLGKLLERLPSALCHLYTLLVVVISWVIFELGSPPEIFHYLGNMFGVNGINIINSESIYVLKSNLILLLIAGIGSVPLFKNVYDRYSDTVIVKAVIMPVFYLIVLSLSIAYLIDSSFNPFLYFRF
ncbi:MBOAT family O-acyltransferase [Chloroflexota bacterium]